MTAESATLTTGETLQGMVFNATGTRRGKIEQTAYGVIVPGPREPVFMDWRQPTDGPPTFLYSVPLPDGGVLVEETSLARAPGLGFDELRTRLHARVGTLTGPVERVRFPVDVPPPPRRARGAIAFGAAAGLIHPATGFSVADAFRLAPQVADTIGRGPRAVRRVIWPWRARLVYRLRMRGLATLLSLTAAEHEEFFDLFFDLPVRHQRAYLSGRADPAGTAAAMLALFRAAPAHLRRKMVNP